MEDKLYNFRIQPAERLSSVQEYYFSVKLKEVARMNAEGKDIISLAIGSPDMPPSPQTIETLCEEARHADAHGYQPTTGIPELRRAMAEFYKRWYDVDLDPACEIQPLIGSKEGILHVTLALANPGDRVLVPNPGYPTYTSLSKILGQRITYYDLLPENGWQPDFKALEEMDLTGVKIMWTNYPNMPTGANARRETYEKLVDFALRHNLVNCERQPIQLHPEPRTPQYLASPRCQTLLHRVQLYEQEPQHAGLACGHVGHKRGIREMDSQSEKQYRLGEPSARCSSPPPPLTGTTPNGTEEANIHVYAERRALAEEIMHTLGCTFDPTQVGMFLWGRIPESCNNVEQLTEKILHEARVFITPGFIFGSNGSRYIRISLCAKKEKIAEALERIRKVF